MRVSIYARARQEHRKDPHGVPGVKVIVPSACFHLTSFPFVLIFVFIICLYFGKGAFHDCPIKWFSWSLSYIHCHGSREWVDISWHYIFTAMDLESGVDISWHYIFTAMDLESGVDISWHYIFTAMELESGGGYIVTFHIHCHGSREWGGYIVTLYIHCHGSRQWVDISWHFIFTAMDLESGWIYRDIIDSLPWI